MHQNLSSSEEEKLHINAREVEWPTFNFLIISAAY